VLLGGVTTGKKRAEFGKRPAKWPVNTQAEFAKCVRIGEGGTPWGRIQTPLHNLGKVCVIKDGYGLRED